MKVCSLVPSVQSGSRSNDSETQRRSIGVDDLAEMASLQARGEVVNHPLASQALDLLCDSIHRMVYKLAHGYSMTCKLDVDDLAQDCMKRIVQRIGTFDRRLAKFTTWSTTVCRSVLNGVYKEQYGWNQKVVKCSDVGELPPEYAPKDDPDHTGLLREDILRAVKILVGKYPERKELIMGFFGHPGRDGSNLSSDVLVTESAKEVGLSYVAARTFYMGVVAPFFKDYFSTHPSANVTRMCGVIDSALTVLEEIKRPMRSKDLFNAAYSRGLFKSRSKKPYIYFINVLGKALAHGEKRIVRVGPAYWTLAGLRSNNPGRSRVLEAALMVLRGAGKPMSAKELFNKAVQRRLYRSEAKRPYDSFFAVLARAVEQGDKRIARAGKGLWRAVA